VLHNSTPFQQELKSVHKNMQQSST